MITKQNAVPATTYATPSRAIKAVEKMHAPRGGQDVKFMISKDYKGRYFPVFVEKITPVSQAEIEANPSANKQPAAKKTAAAASRKRTARGRAAKKVARTRKKATVH